MEFDGRKVKPMRRKGIIRVTQDNQGMKQFQWCDADTKNAIDVSSKSILLYESAITNPSFSLYSQLDQIAVCKGQDVAWHEQVSP